MIQLAFDLGLQTAQPAIWSTLQGDCCTASGVTCDGSQRVTHINWYVLGLNGVINETAIPSSLYFFDLWNNGISGSIPNALPSGLVVLDLDGNQMSGDLPSFPSTLQFLHLGAPGYPGNHFTGSLRLNRPIELRINDNWITDVVIQDSSVLGTDGNDCDLSNNPLLDNPNIAGLTMCTKNDLYSAALLPVTRSTVTTLTKTTTKLTTTRSTTTQMGPLEMTTTTLETTDGATTVEVTTDTVLGHTTAQQMLSSGKASGRITTLGLTSTAGTVTFVQKTSGFSVNLGMILRCIISAMLLTYVLTRTPFRREFKKMMSKGKTATTSALEF